MSSPTRLVELRRYALHPAQREALVALFEARFIESQEELGMSLLGQFHDLDDPDSFVWLRGFAEMASRGRALTAFYDGSVWARYSNEANATMIDSDNVLLLRTPGAQASLNVPGRNPVAEAETGGVVTVVIAPVAHADRALTLFEHEFAGAAFGGCSTLLTYLVSETSPNNFPRLPIREDAHVLVFVVGFPDQACLDAARPGLASLARVVADEGQTPEILRLAPTPRSLLGGNSAPCAFGARIRAAASEQPS
jgi:NIPSNAP